MSGNLSLELGIKRKFAKKFVSSLLEYAVLGHFEDISFTGYDALVFIHVSFGISLSASTVYSTLYLMEKDGLLSSASNGKKRVFTVTKWGKFTFETIAFKADLESYLAKILMHS
jgi:DNA-binding PadR family transcriptional regulator